VFDGTVTISRGAVLANMLDAPVAKLATRHNINARQHFVNAWTLKYN
jgi:hypothetical protein